MSTVIVMFNAVVDLGGGEGGSRSRVPHCFATVAYKLPLILCAVLFSHCSVYTSVEYAVVGEGRMHPVFRACCV